MPSVRHDAFTTFDTQRRTPRHSAVPPSTIAMRRYAPKADPRTVRELPVVLGRAGRSCVDRIVRRRRTDTPGRPATSIHQVNRRKRERHARRERPASDVPGDPNCRPVRDSPARACRGIAHTRSPPFALHPPWRVRDGRRRRSHRRLPIENREPWATRAFLPTALSVEPPACPLTTTCERPHKDTRRDAPSAENRGRRTVSSSLSARRVPSMSSDAHGESRPRARRILPSSSARDLPQREPRAKGQDIAADAPDWGRTNADTVIRRSTGRRTPARASRTRMKQ